MSSHTICFHQEIRALNTFPIFIVFPFRDISLANLRFLSSRQALADLAYFIEYFRKQHNLTNNKLITFGGSYPGM